MTAAAWGDWLLVRSPAEAAFGRRAARRLTVLAYHGIEDAESFARHLDWLSTATSPISVSQFLDVLIGRRAFPPRPVLITFDDGDRSLIDIAAPMLSGRQIPAVAFVVAGLLGTDQPYWWAEAEHNVRNRGRAAGLPAWPPASVVRGLKQMPDKSRRKAIEDLRHTALKPAPRTRHLEFQELPVLEAAGIAVGSHSKTHPCLPRCSLATVREEILGAHEMLAEVLGHPPEVFAYPNGDWDYGSVAVLRAAGYKAAFTFDHRQARLPVSEPLRISRVRVDSTTSIDRFRIVVSGLHPALHHMRGRT